MLGDGKSIGVSFTYVRAGAGRTESRKPHHRERNSLGITVGLILGDNLFYGRNAQRRAETGSRLFKPAAKIFGYPGATRNGTESSSSIRKDESFLSREPKKRKSNFRGSGAYFTMACSARAAY